MLPRDMAGLLLGTEDPAGSGHSAMAMASAAAEDL